MDHARRLRKEQTDAEALLWRRLRNHQLGAKFRRQHRALGFMLDFACVERALAVELDGGQHAEAGHAAADRRRTARLEAAGWRVLRFRDHEVLQHPEAVVDAIWRALQARPPHPGPLPRKRGRGGYGGRRMERECFEGSSGVRGTSASEVSSSRLAAPAPSPPLAGERAGVRGTSAGDAPPADWRPSAPVEALRLRARLNASIRDFFARRGVLEVETPVLSMAGNTDPNIASFSLEFSGRTDGAPRTRWLRTSPEFALKRLLAAGIGDCYELGRVFRDGEAGGRHNPEFTMLEWYRVGWDHRRLARETAELVQAALALVGREARLRETTFRDLYRDALGLDPFTASEAELRAALGDVRIDPDGLARDDWLDLLMTHRIQPAFPREHLLAVIDYPASQCALARIRHDDPPVAERFELYLGPLELANGYHELLDAAEQRARFERDRATRLARGHVAPPQDERLLAALEAGMPACAGVALGVDRLLMAMLDTDRIADVLAFAFDRA
jgi:lysyl-tRNA synthetase class 2